MQRSEDRRRPGRGGRRQPGPSRRNRGVMLLLGTLVLLSLVAAGVALRTGRLSPPMEITSFAMGDTGKQPIFVLGDSFAQNPYFQDQFPAVLPGRVVTIDGVGGSSLAEQLQRFNGQIAGWKSLLVILDGGLTDASATRPIGDIVALLDPGCGRWLYIEPPHSVDHGPPGSPTYAAQVELVAAVKRRWPEHFVRLVDDLLAGSDGSAADQRSVASRWTPESLRQEGDPVHLNAAGNRILVATIARAIARLDASPPPPCSGPNMDQMQGVANAP